MSSPSSAQLTKSQVRQMRDWRIKHGQSVAQRNGEEHEYKRQPRCSADESLFNDNSILVRLERSKEKRQKQYGYCKKGEGTKVVVKWSCPVVWWHCLSCLRCFISQNEIVCCAARCNHCYQKVQGRCALVPMCSIHSLSHKRRRGKSVLRTYAVLWKRTLLRTQLWKWLRTNLHIINLTWSVMKNQSPSKKPGDV